MSNIWFTGDTHFSHYNIIRYTNRPFSSAEEMDETLIANWNAYVQPEDFVYHVGDVFLCPPGHAINLRRRLQGSLCVVRGNHDKTADQIKMHFGWMKDYFKLKVDDPSAPRGVQDIILFHYALRVWDKSHHSSWSLVGHSHNSLPETRHDNANGGLCLDVGVDAVAYWLGGSNPRPEHYRPISYEEVKQIMMKKKELINSAKVNVYPDHHQPSQSIDTSCISFEAPSDSQEKSE